MTVHVVAADILVRVFHMMYNSGDDESSNRGYSVGYVEDMKVYMVDTVKVHMKEV